MHTGTVALISLGGTISSVRQSSGSEKRAGVLPELGAADLAESLGLVDDRIVLETVSLRQVASSSLSFEDVVALVHEIRRVTADGVDGVVITQGTDTLEEVAYLVDLVYAGDAPIVFTGAMRNASAVGADGAANVLAAIQTALSDDARGCGVLTVLNDTIHAARWVSKSNTTNLAAFRSSPVGPVGWVAEGRAHIAFRPLARPTIDIKDLEAISAVRVAVVAVGLADDGVLLGELARLGYQGAVLQALGAGHVPSTMMRHVRSAVDSMPVVLASRTGSGSILAATYGFDGSEIDLAAAGTISSGSLDSFKARILLTLLIARYGTDQDEIRASFHAIAGGG